MLVVVLLVAGVAGAVLWLRRGPSAETSVTGVHAAASAVPASAPTPAPPAYTPPTPPPKPATDQQYFEQLLYLDYVAARGTGMLNDPSEGNKTLWVRVGDPLHGAKVVSLDGSAVVAEHPTLGRVTIPFVGLQAAAPPVLRPYDASPEALPTVYPPSYDPAESAAVDKRIEAMRAAGGGGGGGGGGGRGAGSGGGKRGQSMGPMGEDGARQSTPADRQGRRDAGVGR